MAKLEVRPQSWGVRYLFHCPGCNGGHSFDCRTDGGRPSWTFDGNLDAPTFSPSLLITQPAWAEIEAEGWLTYWTSDDGSRSYRVPKRTVGGDCAPNVEAVSARLHVSPTLEDCNRRVRDILDFMSPAVCHSFIRGGRIDFLGDCTHELAGQTVEIPDVDD